MTTMKDPGMDGQSVIWGHSQMDYVADDALY